MLSEHLSMPFVSGQHKPQLVQANMWIVDKKTKQEKGIEKSKSAKINVKHQLCQIETLFTNQRKTSGL